ncbi:MAG: FliH/SctL family protein [Desulfonatronovibrionaceae bacterium]
MSLSSSGPGGRVIIGLQSRDLQDMEHSEDSHWLDERSQSEFIQRVKEKARDAAREVIASAMKEREEIKARAYEEGLAAGREEARAEREKESKELADKIGRALADISGEQQRICAAYRQDLVLLLRAAVDKVLGWQMEEAREKILFALFDEAVSLLESGREITVRVCEEDKEIVAKGVERLRESRPSLGSVQVVASQELKKGGVVVEDESGMVDNSLDARLEAVRAVLDQVSLEPE